MWELAWTLVSRSKRLAWGIRIPHLFGTTHVHVRTRTRIHMHTHAQTNTGMVRLDDGNGSE